MRDKGLHGQCLKSLGHQDAPSLFFKKQLVLMIRLVNTISSNTFKIIYSSYRVFRNSNFKLLRQIITHFFLPSPTGLQSAVRGGAILPAAAHACRAGALAPGPGAGPGVASLRVFGGARCT